ncbi:hypothetical protein F4808DRAFT_466020 [Astrocystis sublimbata]|nr:hypothetical protein F4808DRAFT_466020 [Astrocystis sublimbata]
MSNEEQKPFLDESQDESQNTLQSSIVRENFAKQQSRFWSPIQKLSVIANLLLLVMCIFLTATIAVKSAGGGSSATRHSNDKISEPYSPAASFIEYEYRPIIPNDTRFTGHPGPEWEHSMHELMTGKLFVG